jgi:hypothetical protein
MATKMIIYMDIVRGFPDKVTDETGKEYPQILRAEDAVPPPVGGFREVGNIRWTRTSPDCLVLNVIGGGQYRICS